jgi:16S rRNA (guanine1516-N2)-methyltransferase
MPETTPTVGLLVNNGGLRPQVQRLAERYGFPLLRSPPKSGFFLCLSPDGLELRQSGDQAPGPVRVEFVSGILGHRLRFGGGRGQPLARAVGMKSGFSPRIWDATGGLGRDAFVLASLGSDVTVCERSPVLAALLEDGLQRAALNADVGPWIQQRMHLVFADASQALSALPPARRPEVVYMDPMYPPGKDSVLVKKEMRALQQLLGADRDSEQLLEVALATATRRVVVKRPKRADFLAGRKPGTCIESKKTRYDVYITL